MTTPAAGMTVDEARPSTQVHPDNESWSRFLVMPCSMLFTCSVIVSLEPAFFVAVPWRLPLLVSWGVYMSLADCVEAYAGLYLPLTPVAVNEAIVNVGFFGIGWSVGFIDSILLTQASSLVMMTFTFVNLLLIVGMLVLGAFLVGRYGQPEHPHEDDLSASASKSANEIIWRDIQCVYIEGQLN
uniref:DUF7378 domain-containing protein n=1 Tax=Leersia perrieri TaxID=77586 RepID=A0A0D9VS33_9ORYZ